MPLSALTSAVRTVPTTIEIRLDHFLTSSLLECREVKLTRREGRLVRLVSGGLKNKEIAATLSIPEGTVKVCLSRLFEKVGAKDRFELALFGLRHLQGSEQAVGLEETPEDELRVDSPGIEESGKKPASVAPHRPKANSSLDWRDRGAGTAAFHAGAKSRKDSGACNIATDARKRSALPRRPPTGGRGGTVEKRGHAAR